MERPVVVVGGGIIGTTIAYRLQNAKVPTILVERDVIPQGASAFSFAALSAFDEPLRAVYLLKTHGMVAWRKLAREFGDDLGVSFPGELRWAESKEAGRHLETLTERACARGYRVSPIRKKQIEEFEPASHPHEVSAGSFAPDDGQAYPMKAIETLTQAFTEAGGERAIGRATVLPRGDGMLVRVGDESVAARMVVLAAGAETSSLLDRLGWDVPMDPSPGLLALTEPVPRFLNGTAYVYPRGDLAVHLRQLDDGRVIVGERAQDEVTRHPTLEHARRLLRQASLSFPALEGVDVDRFTVEWRPMPRDRMPIVGALPGLSSLYVATGHSGVTIAPALAGFVTQEIAERKKAERLEPLRPERFAAHHAEAAGSVEAAFANGPEIFIG